MVSSFRQLALYVKLDLAFHLQPQPGRWGSGRALRPSEQQSAPRVHVYHGICAWAEGQLEGELACPECPQLCRCLPSITFSVRSI